MAFNPDVYEASVVGCTVNFSTEDQSVPMHRHRRGQLITTFKGTVQCELVDGFWPVLPECTLWIPGERPHRTHVSTGGGMCLLYLEQWNDVLPDAPCFVSLTPLVREMIRHMAGIEPTYSLTGADARIGSALVGQLAFMRIEQLPVILPRDPRLRRIAEDIIRNPANCCSVSEWAERVAASERTLARLVRSETGMSFVHWRQHLQVIVAVCRLRSGATVQQVAQDVGYESTNAFADMFKKIMGYPPGQWMARRERADAARDIPLTRV